MTLNDIFKLYMSKMGASSSSSASELNIRGRELLVHPDLLTEIFLHVPDGDLLANCRLVCHLWKNVIDSQTVWKTKARWRGHCAPRMNSSTPLPRHFYRVIAMKNPFGRNLIRNPCGEEDFKFWEILLSGGDGWVVENPPVGVEPLNSVEELELLGKTATCFATSYGRCSKRQVVDLWKEGCSQEVLDQLKSIKIYVCEWYAARWDCGSVYTLRVLLLDKSKEVIDSFAFKHEEPQWTGRAWSKAEHTFEVDSGVRFVQFDHEGHDTQCWAGYYGSKMTNATVRLIVT